MQAFKRFGLFWVDFIVGDDWSLAVVVVLGLGCTWALSRTGFPGWVLLIVLVMTALISSVVRAQRAIASKADAPGGAGAEEPGLP
jgi:hypothetical protein